MLDDLKERLKSEGQRVAERVKESSAYNQGRDRYQNLSPTMQKLIVLLAIVVVVAIVGSIPYSSYVSSSDAVAQFEEQRDLIHDIFKIQQDAQNTSGLTPAPPVESLMGRIDSELKTALLLPEQIKGISPDALPASLPKEHLEGALKVSLGKLNLRQVVDIGYQILAISPALKMLDLSVEANLQDPRYFDVIYKLVTLHVPMMAPPPSEEPEKNNKNPKKASKPVNKGSDD